MARKSRPEDTEAPGSRLEDTVKASAQQIWLAGLGALSKAQEEGGKVFDALVREGLTLQNRTQSGAQEKLTEATARMASIATDLSHRASGYRDRLESVFEERLQRTLQQLGVPSAADFEELKAHVAELQRTVDALRGAPRKTARRTPTTAKAAARKRAPPRSPARKSAA